MIVCKELNKSKKGVSSVIVVVLLMLIAIIVFIVIVPFILKIINDNGEVAEIKQKMMVEDMGIDYVQGDMMNPSNIEISIVLKSGEEFESNKSVVVTQTAKPTEAFLLADNSGSMNDNITANGLNCSYTCNFNKNVTDYRVDYGDCIPYDGKKSSCVVDVCHILAPGVSINGSVKSYTIGGKVHCNYSSNSYRVNITSKTKKCTMRLGENAAQCSNDYCNFNYNVSCNEGNLKPGSPVYSTTNTPIVVTTKIAVSKNATVEFIDAFSNLNVTGNKLGIIPYNASVLKTFSPLSANRTLLKENISKWAPKGGTCICCAINYAKSLLVNPDSQKVMVLMSDGLPNVKCPERPTGDAQKDAVNETSIAFNASGIVVYTVGFGNDTNKSAMKEIAIAGNGSYFDATDVDKLAEVYKQIVSLMNKQYEMTKKWDGIYVVFSNADTSYSYFINDPPEEIWVSKIYNIPIPAGAITNIQKVTIYPVMHTSSGKEVVGPAKDIWTASAY